MSDESQPAYAGAWSEACDPRHIIEAVLDSGDFIGLAEVMELPRAGVHVEPDSDASAIVEAAIASGHTVATLKRFQCLAPTEVDPSRFLVIGPRHASATAALRELEQHWPAHPGTFMGRVTTTFDLTDPQELAELIQAIRDAQGEARANGA